MKSGTRRRSVALGAVAAAAVAVTAACSSGSGPGSGPGASGGPIVIGQEVCQTGYLSATDSYLADGAKIAVDQLNKAGGILGRTVELKTVDTQCVASNEIQLAESFIEK